jgi:hypothetical protein
MEERKIPNPWLSTLAYNSAQYPGILTLAALRTELILSAY